MEPKKKNYMAALFLASVCYGTASILVRFAQNFNALNLTFYRLFISSIAVVSVSLYLRKLGLSFGREMTPLIVSGAILATHFTLFIFSVQNTSIANATFFVNTSPIFVAALSSISIKERVTKAEVLSVIAAAIGVFISTSISLSGSIFEPSLIGDISAIFSAIFYALYTLIGRKMRSEVSNWSYVSHVYSVATFVSLLYILLLSNPIQIPDTTQNFIVLMALALIPTVFGHGFYNYSLKGVKAITANLIAILEPTLASILAFFIFSEVPSAKQILGYSIIAGAIWFVSFKSGRKILQSSIEQGFLAE